MEADVLACLQLEVNCMQRLKREENMHRNWKAIRRNNSEEYARRAKVQHLVMCQSPGTKNNIRAIHLCTDMGSHETHLDNKPEMCTSQFHYGVFAVDGVLTQLPSGNPAPLFVAGECTKLCRYPANCQTHLSKNRCQLKCTCS